MQHSNLKIWNHVQLCLSQSKKIYLLFVLESNGSSPGRQGFLMSVDDEGIMHGSIGGGIMEHKLVELVRERMRSGFFPSQIKFQSHTISVKNNRSGMICSGNQTVFLHQCQNSESESVDSIIRVLEEGVPGTLLISEDGISFSPENPSSNFQYEIHDERWIYREKLGYKNRAHIYGGGHCALALSRILSIMDFHVTLIENRAELNTFIQNDFAHKKLIINDYSILPSEVLSDTDAYHIVMTFGYRTDTIVMQSLLQSNFDYKYLGVMGSKSKMQEVLQSLLLDGFDSNKLQKIKTPIGLQIKSETPEEIAVSIAAEIIHIKNQN